MGFELTECDWKSEERGVKRLQGEVGLVKTALRTSSPSPIYLQIMFVGSVCDRVQVKQTFILCKAGVTHLSKSAVAGGSAI